MRDVTLVILIIKCHIRRPLTTLGILINFNDNWVSGSPPKSVSVHFLTVSLSTHFEKN